MFTLPTAALSSVPPSPPAAILHHPMGSCSYSSPAEYPLEVGSMSSLQSAGSLPCEDLSKFLSPSVVKSPVRGVGGVMVGSSFLQFTSVFFFF